jgi:hypothetical protein
MSPDFAEQTARPRDPAKDVFRVVPRSRFTTSDYSFVVSSAGG